MTVGRRSNDVVMVSMTTMELDALFTFLAVALNDPDTMETMGLTSQEKYAVRRAARKVDQVHADSHGQRYPKPRAMMIPQDEPTDAP